MFCAVTSALRTSTKQVPNSVASRLSICATVVACAAVGTARLGCVDVTMIDTPRLAALLRIVSRLPTVSSAV